MAQAKTGDRVRLDFTGKLQDGTVFDSTVPGQCSCDDCGCGEGPMEMVVGDGEFFAEIDEALVGMVAGEKKTVVIPAGKAFGGYEKERIFTVGRDQLPEDLSPEVGEELEFTGEDDESFVATVVEVGAAEVTLDANHPLAGEDLTFDLELVTID